MKYALTISILSLAGMAASETSFDPVNYPTVCVGALTSYQEEQGLDIDKRTAIANQVTFFFQLDNRLTGKPIPNVLERVFLVNKLRKRVERDFNMFELTDIRKKCEQAYHDFK